MKSNTDKLVPISLRLEPELAKKLDAQVKAERRTRTAVIVYAIEQYLKKASSNTNK